MSQLCVDQRLLIKRGSSGISIVESEIETEKLTEDNENQDSNDFYQLNLTPSQ